MKTMIICLLSLFVWTRGEAVSLSGGTIDASSTLGLDSVEFWNDNSSYWKASANWNWNGGVQSFLFTSMDISKNSMSSFGISITKPKLLWTLNLQMDLLNSFDTDRILWNSISSSRLNTTPIDDYGYQWTEFGNHYLLKDTTIEEKGIQLWKTSGFAVNPEGLVGYGFHVFVGTHTNGSSMSVIMQGGVWPHGIDSMVNPLEGRFTSHRPQNGNTQPRGGVPEPTSIIPALLGMAGLSFSMRAFGKQK